MRRCDQPSETVFRPEERNVSGPSRDKSNINVVSYSHSRTSLFRRSINKVRFLVVLVCSVGFLWHSIGFLQIFLEFHTVVEIQVDNKMSLGLPAITVCNDNRISKRSWCKENPETCYPWKNETMENYVDRLENIYKKLDKKSRIRLGLQKTDVILECKYEGDENVNCMNKYGFFITTCWDNNIHY
ncbi:uncharacterized protein LOC143226996 [Tachypleus tridentatus]|uniref:uncharacterized protein LOC143226996 n=1 Tax=Tachypleus tridentatus TaxID=6853 RepID=UPI003FD2FF3C